MAGMSQMRGYLITLEGGEGSGKSTQIKFLVSFLRKHKIPFHLSREPGGTRLGDRIRKILLNPNIRKMSNRTELLLYEADRAEHVDQVIHPQLSSGKVVICDRFYDSSTVYQGICRGVGLEMTRVLNRFATGGLTPNLTFLLDIPEKKGMERVKRRRRLDRLEREKFPFHNQVRRGFLYLAKKEKRRFCVIDASQGIPQVSLQIERVLIKRLKQRGYL